VGLFSLGLYKKIIEEFYNYYMFSNLLKKRIFIYTGLFFALFAIFSGLKSYSYQSESAIANSIESARHYIDSLDGEIEDMTNPDVSLPEVPVQDQGQNGQVLGTNQAPTQIKTTRTGPDRLVIDKLEIDAYIQHVGLARSGNMGVPTNFKDVGWYKLGPEPGEAGNAVIAGHLDNALGLAGVFSKISTLESGDIIVVKNADGKTRRFKVVKKQIYDYTSADTREIFKSDGPSRLVLITCSGTWLRSERSYTSRLVVFADLIQ
jgi:LPXTG-site transpeptidase (sortase) family protein